MSDLARPTTEPARPGRSGFVLKRCAMDKSASDEGVADESATDEGATDEGVATAVLAEHRITAVLIEDHDVVQEGIGRWCERANPPIDLLDVGDRPATAWLAPGADADVVIMDLQLKNGVQEFGELRRLAEAGRRIVVYSQDETRDTAVHCINLGALSYVAKSEVKEHLVAAVRAAAEGEPYTPPALSGSIVGDADPNRPRLTRQEMAALRAWFASSSKERAGKMLGISARTVDTYIERARVKYAAVGRPAPSKSAMVKRALEDGLVTLEDLELRTD